MSYTIAIPSYNRVIMLKNKTIKLLEKHKIPKKQIIIFVANKEEEISYKEHFKDYQIIIGQIGLKNQRNFIQDYFPVGSHIVQMDDDVSTLYQLKFTNNSNKYKQKIMIPLTNLDKFIKNAFKYTITHNFNLWGIYPIDNAYFMNDNISHDLRIIVGPFWGHIIRHDIKLKNTVNEKEDIERTIKYYIKDGGVVRFNNISLSTMYYKNKGGMGKLEDRVKDAMKSVNYLVNKYPDYCKINLNKKSGMPDIKLIRNPKI